MLLLFLLTLSPLSLALPATTDSPFPVPWVTVDVHGSATTITPAVITTEGHLTTISAAPDNLLYTTTYTFSPGTGQPSTYTGLPPVATATGAEEGSLAGVFPACGPEANVGVVEPFCLPRGGSRLFPGRTYYITWSPSYFPPETQLTLQIFFTNSSFDPSRNTDTETDTDPINDTLGTPGLSIPSLSSSTGFYPWPIPPDFLTTHNIPVDQSLTLTFALSYHSSNTNPDSDSNSNPSNKPTFVTSTDPNDISDTTLRIGPTVYLTPTSQEEKGEESSKNPHNLLLQILLPVLLVILCIATFTYCVLSARRNGGHLPCVGIAVSPVLLGRRRGQVSRGIARLGEGEQNWNGKSGVDGGVGAGGVELTDRGGSSPGIGRNVFREEVQRQERERGKG